MMRAAWMLWHGFLVLYAALYLLGIFLVRTFTANDKLALSLAAALSVIFLMAAPRAQELFRDRLLAWVPGLRPQPLEWMRELTEELPAALDPQMFIDYLERNLIPRLGLRQTAIFIRRGGAPETLYARGFDAQTLEDLRATLSAWLLAQDGTESDTSHPLQMDQIAVPLMLHGRPVGAWLIGGSDLVAADESEWYPFLRAVGSLLAIAVENARLFSAIQDELRLRTEQEAQLRMQTTALQSAANAILIANREGLIQWVNPAFEKLTGYSLEEVRGKTPRILKSGRQDLQFYRELWNTILAGDVWRGKLINRRKDGSLYVEEQTITPVLDEQAEIQSFIAIKEDASERERAQRDIRALREFNESVVETIREGIVASNAEGIITFMNPALEELLGYRREELVGEHSRKIFPEDQHHILEEADALRMRGESSRYMVDLLHRDGTRIPVLISGSPRFEGEEFVGTLAAVTDMRDQKKVETQLREVLEFNAGIVQQMAEGIVIQDEEGRFTFANPAALQMLGYSLEELLELPWTAVIHPGDHEIVRQADSRRQRGEADRYEARLIRKDGGIIHVLVAGRPRMVEGQFAGSLAVFTDVTAQKQAAEQIQKQIEHLQALRSIDIAIAGSLDINVTLEVLLSQVLDHLQVDAGAVFLLDPHESRLRYEAGAGFRGRAFREVSIPLTEGLVAQAVRSRKTIPFLSFADEPDAIPDFPAIQEEGFTGMCLAPLIAKGRVLGVLAVFTRGLRELDEAWPSYLEAMAARAAIAVDNAAIFRELNESHLHLSRALDEVLMGWARTVELRSGEGEGHTERVVRLSLQLARQLGMRGEELVHLRRGALLHDIGNLALPDALLRKPKPLTPSERAQIEEHPAFAYAILSPIEFLRPAIDIPFCHHERWDGSGYPRHLRGETIPLIARIFAVVDVWAALTSDRPHREAWSEEKACNYLKEQAGVLFDPGVVEVFLKQLGTTRASD